MFIRSFNHFRALAIVVIVSGHSEGVSGFAINTTIDEMAYNLINGGTSLFVFISGVLFHHVFYRRYEYGEFVRQKVRNVFVPYLLLASLAFVVFGLLLDSSPHPELHFCDMEGLWCGFLSPWLTYTATGDILTAYWYIPFIMGTFLLAPLHFRFVGLGFPVQLAILLALFGLSALIHRPPGNLFVPQSIVYFAPMYLLGIICSIHREAIYRALLGREWLFLAAALFLAWYQTAVDGVLGNYYKRPFEYGGVDVVIFQKVLLCLFLMVFLHRFEALRSRLIETVAAGSFAIYFLHGWIINLSYGFSARILPSVPGGYLWPVISLTIVALCLAIGLGIKSIAGARSRLLIGW